MLPYLREEFGNAASRTHEYGWRAEAAVEQAREEIAAAIGAREPREIVFTSGATESDNLALKGLLRARRERARELVISALEHPAVADTAEALGAEGFAVRTLPVDGGGLVDPGGPRRGARRRNRPRVGDLGPERDRRGPAGGRAGAALPRARRSLPQRRGPGRRQAARRRGARRHRPAVVLRAQALRAEGDRRALRAARAPGAPPRAAPPRRRPRVGSALGIAAGDADRRLRRRAAPRARRARGRSGAPRGAPRAAPRSCCGSGSAACS